MMMLTPSEVDFSAAKEARLGSLRTQVAQWFTIHLELAPSYSPREVSVTSRGDYDEIMIFLPPYLVEQAEAQARRLEQELFASGTPAYVYVRGSNGGGLNL